MMRFKKVIFNVSLALIFLGCSSQSSRWSQGEKVKILSTTAQVADLVSQVGGDRIDLKILIKGDLDPHSYEIVKGDGEKFEQADLIFYNGLGLEHGASVSTFLKSSSKAISIGDRINAAKPGKILFKGGVIDPHIWMDISLWKEGVDPVVKALSEKDPEGANGYFERGEQFKKELDDAHLAVYQKIQQIPTEKRYLVTSHDAFHYFTRTYFSDDGEIDWEKRFAAPEGLAPEGQLSVRDIQKVIDYIAKHRISVIFPESNVSKDSLQKIASAGREMGLEIQICRQPLYGDAMGGQTYLQMMKTNAETIERHLSNMR